MLVYQQAADFPSQSTFNFYTSGYGVDGGSSRGFQTYDNFTLTSTAQLDRITFQVAYWDYQNPSNNPVQPDTTAAMVWRSTTGCTSGVSPCNLCNCCRNLNS